MSCKKAAIVGSGFVGQSWAMLFAGAGYTVHMYDIKEDQLTKAINSIAEQLHKLHGDGLLRGSLNPDQQLGLISTTTDLATAMKGASWVQESVFEDVNLKKKVFSELDKHAEEGMILASSTSAILPKDFTYQMKLRSNAIVCHPCNPPYYCPAVEVVPGLFTDKAVVDKAVATLKELGQSPVLVKKQVPGFVLNRLQYALMGEAMRLVQNDVCSVEDVDKIMSEAMGMRYAFLGTLAVAHLNAPNGFADYAQRYGAMIQGVQKDLGPPPAWTPALVEKIVTGLEKVIPGEQFQDTIKWRNECLAELAKLKKTRQQPGHETK